MELLEILSKTAVLNKDNGKHFETSDRLDNISSLVWESKYRRINPDGLFQLYSKKPVEELRDQEVIVISSHVDCEAGITQCYSEIDENDKLHGVYDNAITNAAILSLMLSDDLPDDVLVAFTGDEEAGQKGAKHLVRYLKKKGITIRELYVLDVTYMGWNENYDFTIENDFWRDESGRKVVKRASETGYRWGFVPGDPGRIPSFVPRENVIRVEAMEDESWYYDEKGVNCCSICLPVKGKMHSDEGVWARERSFRAYTDALRRILTGYGSEDPVPVETEEMSEMYYRTRIENFSRLPYLTEVYERPGYDEYYYFTDGHADKDYTEILEDLDKAAVFSEAPVGIDSLREEIMFAPYSFYDDEEELKLIWERRK